MALDEYIFGKFVRYFKNRKPSEELLARTVELSQIKQRLLIFARAISGKPIEIFPAVREGGFKGENFFLPQKMDFYPSREQNLAFYFFRTIYLATQQKMQINWYEKIDLPSSKAFELAQEHSEKILNSMFEEYPILAEIYEGLSTEKNPETEENIEATWLFGKLMSDELNRNKQNDRSYQEAKLKASENPTPKTILKTKAVEEIVNLTIDMKQQEDYVLTHNFEKIETADEFSGTWRDFDGDDELEEHSDALDDLTMKFTVRTNDITHSVFQAEYKEDANIAESAENEKEGISITYDEWDYTKNQYKKDFVRIFLENQNAIDQNYYHLTIKQHQTLLLQLRKLLANISNRRVEVKRQTDGREIDIDVAVDRFAELISRQTPTERVYISDRKREKDLSILFLIDISLSSDSYADGNRVIDVAKQTTILFGEILNEYDVDFSIQCFYSQTRNKLTYLTVKDFDEKWNSAKYKIGAIQPIGYTRIGGALRHSGSLLSSRENENKWVILLSDGKPNDYDRYEGRYGINDVKQALREQNQNHINSYALAIESEARFYLPQMFGQNHYQVVSSPKELLHSMVQLYEKLRFG